MRYSTLSRGTSITVGGGAREIEEIDKLLLEGAKGNKDLVLYSDVLGIKGVSHADLVEVPLNISNVSTAAHLVPTTSKDLEAAYASSKRQLSSTGPISVKRSNNNASKLRSSPYNR
ncbi:hypothetical protein REPUB_Repub01dG0050700 [Reevesia pubescens]